jgi:uncharacterized protein YifN (PemK superfamily)
MAPDGSNLMRQESSLSTGIMPELIQNEVLLYRNGSNSSDTILSGPLLSKNEMSRIKLDEV